MKLRHIEGRNVKGRTFSHDLSDAVAIIGPNFAGKSAIPDTIRLAFMGYLPEVGKLPKATWELSSGQSMEVCAKFDDGSQIKREFIDGKSGVSIGSEMFVDSLASIPLLNAEHYFGLTDTQRTNYVFERIKLPDTYSSESIIAGIERLSLGEAHTDQVEKAKQALMVDVRKCFKNSSTIQDALTEALELFRQRFTYWNARAKETQGAVTTLTELKLRENEISADSIAAIQRSIKEASERKEDLDTRKGALTQERDGSERTAGRRRQLRQLLDADRIDYPRMLEQEKAKKEALKKDLVPEPKNKDIERLREEIKTASEVKQRAQTTFDRQGQVIKEAEDGLNQLGTLKACPYCKSKAKGWSANLEAELTQRKTDALGLQKVANKQMTTAEGIIAEDTEKLNAMVGAQEKNRRTQELIRDADRRIEAVATNQTAEKEKRERWEAEIAEMPKSEDAKGLNHQISELENERLEVAKELSTLNGKREAARSLAQDLKRAAQAQLEHEDAGAYVVMVKSIATYLKEKRSGIVTDVFDKLLKVANRLCGDILMTPIALHDGTIGRWSDTKFIPHRVFSGTEKALAYIAIAIALSADAPIRIPILDEFGRLDKDNQREVISILNDMVTDEVIDQFIIIGTDLPDYVPGMGSNKRSQSETLQVIEVNP